jgi:hypothetical protein
MLYPVLVSKEGNGEIPHGTAILAGGRNVILVFHDDREPFGERCAKAACARPSPISDQRSYTRVGSFDSIDGELRFQPHGAALLSRWLGHPVQAGDLMARDNRSARRHRARRLFYQGRYAEALRIDRRMGL